MTAYRALCVWACVVLFVCGSAAAQNFDFGDLPDPTYPTAISSNGPAHIQTIHEWIGTTTVSQTTTEAAPKTPDLDEDDGSISIDNIYEGGVFANMAMISVPVTTDATTDTRYLNVVADLNGDGGFMSFDDGGQWQFEWLVCNRSIVFTEETKIITAYCGLISPLVSVAARRATLTTVPIDPTAYGDMGWDGTTSGVAWNRGETEDHMTPYFSQNIDWHPDGEGLTWYPGDYDELTSFTWQWPPPGGKLYEDGPGKWNGPGGGGNGRNGPDAEKPKVPADPEEAKPEPPAGAGGGVVTYPPGWSEGLNPVNGKASVKGMPDIKQGKNECVPTCAANSIRYLMNQDDLDDAAVSEGYAPDSEGLNRKLQEELKKAMKTNKDAEGNPDNSGTDISFKGDNDNFRKAKKNANVSNAMKGSSGENRINTTAVSNPSLEQIMEAIKKGKDVELNIGYYAKATKKRQPTGHMIVVTGYAVHEDGSVELFYHDPADRRAGEGSGDTADPARELSIRVSNDSGEPPHPKPSDGGLVTYGGKLAGTTETAVINGMYAESLCYKDMTAKQCSSDAAAGNAPVGSNVNIFVPEPSPGSTGPELKLATAHEPTRQAAIEPGNDWTGFFYQWLKDGDRIPDEHGPVLLLENVTAADSGVYGCWIYDRDLNMYNQATTTTLLVVAPARAEDWELLE